VGAVGWRVVANQLPRLSTEYGVPEPALRRMLHRYGDELPDVLAPIANDRSLGVPVTGTAGYLPVEFLWAVTHEGASTLDDVLTRRTRVAIEDPGAGTDAADEVARLIAPALGWDATRQKEEVESYAAQPRLATLLWPDARQRKEGGPPCSCPMNVPRWWSTACGCRPTT